MVRAARASYSNRHTFQVPLESLWVGESKRPRLRRRRFDFGERRFKTHLRRIHNLLWALSSLKRVLAFGQHSGGVSDYMEGRRSGLRRPESHTVHTSPQGKAGCRLARAVGVSLPRGDRSGRRRRRLARPMSIGQRISSGRGRQRRGARSRSALSRPTEDATVGS